MSKLYEAHVTVDNRYSSDFNSIEQRLEAAGLHGVHCFFDMDCIRCDGYMPLDKLYQIKYIEGVIGVTLDVLDGLSD